MEVSNNIMKQTNTDVSLSNSRQSRAESSQNSVVEQIQKDAVNNVNKIDSQEKLEDLVKELNRSLDPFNTSIKFGFDNRSEDFYVSVIEAQTHKVLRRFPAEQAVTLLPKMQEVTGILFDTKG